VTIEQWQKRRRSLWTRDPLVTRLYRQCDFKRGHHGLHVWERVNDDLRPFRRGRVVFLCAGEGDST
jgi:hypothetical protein